MGRPRLPGSRFVPCRNCGKEFWASAQVLEKRPDPACSRECRKASGYAHHETIPELERFESYVSKELDENGCRLWNGGTFSVGYGNFSILRDGSWHSVYAHIYMYEHLHGPIPDGKFVCHSCDVRRCVNDDHFFLGTNQENMQDASRKGRLTNRRRGTQHHKARLTEDQVIDIRRRADGGEPIYVIAKDYPVGERALYSIVNRDTWVHIP